MHGRIVVTSAERAVDALIGVLARRGYTVIAPTVRDGAIVLDEVGGVADLPIGWSDDQEAATYRLHLNDSRSLFAFAVGPYSPRRSRGDDGVGWIVAAAAGRRLAAAVDLRLCDGEPARLLDAWTGGELAVVVDATRSGAAPGTVRLLETEGAIDLTPSPAPVGSHSMGIGQAQALGRAVGRLPRRLVVIGIEGRHFGFSDELSAPVAEAVDAAADLVVRVVDGDRGDGGPATPAVAPSRDDEDRDPGAGDHGLAGRAELAECAAHTPAAHHDQVGPLAIRDP